MDMQQFGKLSVEEQKALPYSEWPTEALMDRDEVLTARMREHDYDRTAPEYVEWAAVGTELDRRYDDDEDDYYAEVHASDDQDWQAEVRAAQADYDDDWTPHSTYEEEMRARVGNEWYENGLDLSELGDDWDQDYLHGAASDYDGTPERDHETVAERDAAENSTAAYYRSLADVDISRQLAQYRIAAESGTAFNETMFEDNTALLNEQDRRRRNGIEVIIVTEVDMVPAVDDLPF